MKGIADTSLLVVETNEDYVVPEHLAISVMTLAELIVGVLTARDSVTKSKRMKTLSRVEEEISALPVDKEVVRCFAELATDARDRGRKPKVIDTLIAATAMAYDLPVYTRDNDFAAFEQVESVVLKD